MNFFRKFANRFRRRGSVTSADGGGIEIKPGVADEGAPEESGRSPFSGRLELAQWILTQEAKNLANLPYDPFAWQDGRIRFEAEEMVAAEHRKLRERLGIFLHQQIIQSIDDVSGMANAVGERQTILEDRDRDLLRAQRHWAPTYAEVCQDKEESDRYVRLKSLKTKQLKYALAAIFVLSEWAMTGIVVDHGLPASALPGLGYVLAIGMIAVLIAAPHFAAQGLKRGLITHNKPPRGSSDEDSTKASREARLRSETEIVTDKGFRILAGLLMVLAFGFLVSIAIIRGSDWQGNHALWLIVFLFLQLSISVYFFFREWHDYGLLSNLLVFTEEEKNSARDEREEAYAEYTGAVADYLAVAVPSFRWYIDGRRHDQIIKEAFQNTLAAGRHVHTVANSDLQHFIDLAVTPKLDATIDRPVWWTKEQMAPGKVDGNVATTTSNVPAQILSIETLFHALELVVQTAWNADHPGERSNESPDEGQDESPDEGQDESPDEGQDELRLDVDSMAEALAMRWLAHHLRACNVSWKPYSAESYQEYERAEGIMGQTGVEDDDEPRTQDDTEGNSPNPIALVPPTASDFV